MTALELIGKLRDYQVVPRLEQGKLKLVGQTEQIDATFLEELKVHKQLLIDFLTAREEGKEMPIVPTVISDHYQVTNAQQRMWVLSQFDGGNVAYNISDAFYVEGELTISLFEQAFQLAVNKHESLRTCFLEVNDNVYQTVVEKLDFKLEVETLNAGENSIQKVKEIEKHFRNTTFDLSKPGLLRVKLVTVEVGKHILLFNMHHIVSDGWSLGVLLQEVMADYKRLSLGEPIVNTIPEIQFKDYAAWLSERLNGDYGSRGKQFWQEKELNAVEPINLPIDYVRPEYAQFEGATQKFYFADSFYEQIESYARKQQTTLFNLYRAVIGIVLHKWTNQQRLIIGTPVAGRSHSQLSDQIGLFVNTLPLVSEFDGKKNITDYIKEISSDSLAVFNYQDYPLDKIIEENNIIRDTSRNPLFDVLMVVQNTALGDGSIEVQQQHGFTLNKIEAFYHEGNITERTDIASKFDISFYFSVDPDQKFYLEIEYKTTLFKKAKIQAFYKMFEYVFTQIIENDSLTLGEIQLVDSLEVNRILNELNQPIARHSEKNLLDLLLPAMELLKDQPSVHDAVGIYTPDEVLQLASAISSQITGLPTRRVGLFMSRTSGIVSAILGCWQAGKTYVPIDITYPVGRMEYIINDADVKVLLVDSESEKVIPSSYKGTIIRIDELNSSEYKADYITPESFEEVAYLIYTSGSTGQPKGVEITHYNVIAFLKWCAREFAATPYDILFAGTSYCFDLSVFEMLLPFYQGKQLRILQSGVEIADHLQTYKRIFINTVPSVIRSLIDQGVSWENVVAINMAGEPVPRIFKDILDYKNIEIRNLYGPSEDTTYSTNYRFEDDGLNYIPIGVPVGDTQLYILDQDLNLLPIGVEGEICLSGASIAKGYLNKPELTAEKFIPNPFIPGEWMYRTGDIGKWTEKGHVAFTGRMDDQVKVRGFRIELGEVQYQLDCIEEIDQAIAIVRELKGEKTLIAYYQSTSSISKEVIKERLEQQLPQYMIPSFFVEMEQLPMNSNGKIDKKQLPDPEDITQNVYIEPVTETQKRLLSLWENVLQKTGFGLEGNFFELGGHSLKATKLKSLILREFNKEITLNELFRLPTIPPLAELIDSKPLYQEHKIDKVELSEEALIPLSYAQERLWVLTKFEKASRAYHMPAAFYINGNLNTTLLESAILCVIDRHESLRTLFREKNGVPYQHIVSTEALSFALTHQELNQQTSIEAYLQESWAIPFDLENGPLVRCEIIRNGKETILSFNMHHIISDGWSVGVLFQDVMQSYAQLCRGESGSLQQLDVQYVDFTHWQQEQLSGEALAAQLNFWKDEVFEQEIPVLELPYDFLRPELKTFNGATRKRLYSTILRDKLQQQAATYGASLYMAVMANVSILLKKLSNQSDIVIGTPVSGREATQLQSQIGFYVNTLPVRVTPVGSLQYSTLLENVRSHLLKAFNYQHFPFEMLVEAIQPARDLSRSPLFDVMVVMQNFDVFENSHLQLEDSVSFEKLNVSSGATKYDLTFSFTSNENGLELEMEYNTDLFREETIVRFMDQLERVFEQTTANELIHVEAVSLISEPELDVLLSRSDFTGVDYEKEETIVSYFQRVVASFPDRIALQVEDRTWTYSELDQLSGQLARTLVNDYGVQDEDLIVLHTQRNEWMLIAILAVLKAGGVYVPVDPEYPASRIQYILEDSGSQLILADNDPNPETASLFESATWLDISKVTYEGEAFSKSLSPSQLAYIIYTSGTTGNPKGVLIEHGNVTRLLFNDNDYFDFNEQDSWSLFHSYCFDFSVWEMYGALLKGGRLVMVPKVIAQDGEAFFNFLSEEKITVLNQTPTAFRSLCLTNEKQFAQTPMAVRYVIFGGEALMPSSLKEWNSHYSDCKLINMYGITETTVHVTYKEIGKREIEENKSNIGVPIPTLSCYVLDADLQPCAPGVIGELCVGGAGVARGYHNKPELTAEKFVTSSFNNSGRLYRSGDFARWLANGDMEYIGRKDEQVKIRGHRIELAEVEEGIKALPYIDDAIVLAKKNTAGEFELIAYFILSDQTLEVNLREALTGKLPAYMIPSHYIPLTHFPMTSNGKLDKKALPEVSGEAIKTAEYVAPENEIQETIIGIWEDVLGKTGIGIRDNFFDLGGHSLKATRVIAKIQEIYGVKIDLASLFIDPTVASLSEHVSTLVWMSEDENVESAGDELII